ncbi:ankyrin repeat protein [Acanthamoeba polyphaga mimivirus]|uniref:Ankyrin repeat protein n=2 Tax=Megamimivirinae TaxID=3044648 RepID=A0A2L2DLK4_MIMIV|nr:putative ankyrin repeat protein [Megavirus chiliensis]AEQ33267.1 ankyrin repeat protein [Megavirus chiliensis]AVG45948.1 ankyrin repeat protein [Acanthamoeba polyphaga mimivirus]AVG47051.1 ankyrin repeat protein [Acanthamoeba polyphaga mimivirus]
MNYQDTNIPTYTKHYYENKIINSNSNWKYSELYKYCEQYPQNKKLKEIMETNLSEEFGNGSHYLLITYGDLMKNNLIDEIIDIIPKCGSDELFIIAISCIENHCYRILDELIKIGFDFNSNIPIKICMQMDYTLFSLAIDRQDYEIIKYLADNEINISNNNTDTWILALSSINEHIFEYTQQFDFDISTINHSFWSYYERACKKNYMDIKSIHKRLQYFFDKGIDINEFYKNNNGLFYRCSIDIFKILIDNGLIINDNTINEAIPTSNLDIIEYLIELGYKPNNETIQYVLEKFNLNILQLLIRYNINLSDVPTPPFNELVNSMIDNGLDYATICHYMANNYTKKNYSRSALSIDEIDNTQTSNFQMMT